MYGKAVRHDPSLALLDFFRDVVGLFSSLGGLCVIRIWLDGESFHFQSDDDGFSWLCYSDKERTFLLIGFRGRRSS